MVRAIFGHWCPPSGSIALISSTCTSLTVHVMITQCLGLKTYIRAASRFAPSQWETALLCNDVSHWLGASLESAFYTDGNGDFVILINQNNLRCINHKRFVLMTYSFQWLSHSKLNGLSKTTVFTESQYQKKYANICFSCGQCSSCL